MNKFLKQILIRIVLKNKRDQDNPAQECTDQELKEAWKIFKINTIRYFKDIILITIGIFSAAFGFKGFLLTNHFIDGGATGISLLISALTSMPLALLLIVINIPFIILGYSIIGRAFAIKTAIAISGLALVVATVTFPDVTKDNLLVALFGGFFPDSDLHRRP